MDEGLSAEVGGTGTVLANAPHPRAAQLFLNWWYSQDGMETDIKLHAQPLNPSPKLRSDVSQGKVDDLLWNRVGQLQSLLDDDKVFIVDQGVPEYDDDRTATAQLPAGALRRARHHLHAVEDNDALRRPGRAISPWPS